ncbi:MAG TPA: HAD family hydrolase [Thermoanaerobaculia bacterium]|nr:HAD family hydrolase [Thermoanaerobaculia bacterium]
MDAVAFDLWETLITDTPRASRLQEDRRLAAMERLLREAGRPHARESIEAAYRHTWHRCHELYWSQDRDIPPRRQIEHMLEHLLGESDPLEEPLVAAIEHAYAFAAAQDLPELVDGAADVVAALGARYPLGLISNTGRTPGWVLREVLRKLGLADAFRVLVFSNEHGECKPVRSIFETLRTALGIPAGRIVFVGDNLYADVWGAQQAGMRAVHFDNPARGQAIGPLTREVGPIAPHATIRSLRELPALLEEWER